MPLLLSTVIHPMIIAGGFDWLTDAIGKTLEAIFTGLMYGGMTALLYAFTPLFTLTFTILSAVGAPMIIGMSKFITGEFMTSLYSDALMVSDGGTLSTALHSLFDIVGDVSNVLIVYGVVFTAIYFLCDLYDKSSRSELDLMTFAKSLITFVAVTSLIGNASSVAGAAIAITGDITKQVFDETNTAIKTNGSQKTEEIWYDENGNATVKEAGTTSLSTLLANGIVGYEIANTATNEMNDPVSAIASLATGIGDDLFKPETYEDENLSGFIKVVGSVVGGIISPVMGSLKLAVGLVVMAIPFLVVLVVDIFCLSVFLTRGIQLAVYTVFMPIAITDMYHNGLVGSSGMRYIKKFAAIGLQGIVLYITLILAQLFIGSVGVSLFSGSSFYGFDVFGGIGNALLFMIVAVATAFTSFSLALKSQQIANDIVG